MQRARRDGRGVAVCDELGQKVVCLLAMHEPGESAVLAFEKHTREDEDVDEEARLALGEPEAQHSLNPPGRDAVTELGRNEFHHRSSSSATRGSNPRPPPRPPLLWHRNPDRATL